MKMTDRGRLIALLIAGANKFSEKGMLDCNAFADYLLEHGVVVPHCKVGDTVFEDGLSSVIKFKVIGFKFGRMYDQDIEDFEDDAFPDEWHIEIDSGSGWKQSVPFSQIGKTVFLTREEAEQALKERVANEL